MADRNKIMILPFGEWKGHPMGEESYGREEAEQIVSYFNLVKERSGGKPVLIDYEHQSLNPALAGLVPAAGWLYSMEIGDDAIYGEVEWTEKAKQAIKDKELLSLSPVIATKDIDPVTGEVVPISIFNLAATNQPFMHDKMELLVASAVKARSDEAKWYTNSKQITFINQGGVSMDIAQKFAELKAALGLAETAGPEEVIGLVKKMAELMAALPGAPGEGMPTAEQMPEMETEMKQAVMNSRILNSVATFLAVDPDKVLPTVTAMSNKTAGVDETKTKLAEMETKLKERDIADLLIANTAKIPPAKREFWQNYAKTNGVEATKSVLDEMPEVLPSAPSKTTDAEKIDSERIALANKMGLTPEDIKTFSRNKEAK